MDVTGGRKRGGFMMRCGVGRGEWKEIEF